MKIKDYSTVIVVNKQSHKTKSYSVKQKHILRLHLYKRMAFVAIFVIVAAFVLLGFYISQIEHQKQRLYSEVSSLENMLDERKIYERLNGIDSAEHALKRIEMYLKYRKVPVFPANNGNTENMGGEDVPIQPFSVEMVDYKKEWLSDMLHKIQVVPVGLPCEGRLTSPFGARIDPINSENGLTFHSGLDIANEIGTPISVTANGKVVFADYMGGYGKCVIVQHGFGYETLYGHLSRISVKNGQNLKAGDKLGELGDTGRSSGPHLHYEVILEKQKKNPRYYLEIE